MAKNIWLSSFHQCANGWNTFRHLGATSIFLQLPQSTFPQKVKKVGKTSIALLMSVSYARQLCIAKLTRLSSCHRCANASNPFRHLRDTSVFLQLPQSPSLQNVQKVGKILPTFSTFVKKANWGSYTKVPVALKCLNGFDSFAHRWKEESQMIWSV